MKTETVECVVKSDVVKASSYLIHNAQKLEELLKGKGHVSKEDYVNLLCWIMFDVAELWDSKSGVYSLYPAEIVDMIAKVRAD